ncbi:TPA: XRE family transcriptional regulator [Bacillus cereus]|nr:transcriptional regulator [Bacillus thuringiensis]PFU71784.1 transcriptional regulator [Bacillus thuringiensis]HDR8128228.1 XRE family transcriptional regulator [Bacillus cereus]HDR8492566.1 XRE family transcriptional regulator [Bacillus cereus]
MKVTPLLSEILAEHNLRQKNLAEMAETTKATISRALDLKIEDLFNIEA